MLALLIGVMSRILNATKKARRDKGYSQGYCLIKCEKSRIDGVSTRFQQKSKLAFPVTKNRKIAVMGNWLHFLYDREKGILWRNVLPVSLLVLAVGFAWGVATNIGGLSVPEIWKLVFPSENQTIPGSEVPVSPPKTTSQTTVPENEVPVVPGLGSSQRIAIGDWVQGTWLASEFATSANIFARIDSSDYFKLFRNPSRVEVRSEGGGQALYENGRRISDIFDEIKDIRLGATSYGANVVAASVRRGNQWTVAINGKPWRNWFDELYGYPVVSRDTAIGVRIGSRWTIAVNGAPWIQLFDSIHNYSIFPNGSVVLRSKLTVTMLYSGTG